MKSMKKLVVVLTLLMIAGCGSNSSTGTVSTTTSAGTAVNLAAFKSVFTGNASGTSFNFPVLLGSDLQGHVWSGSYSVVANGTTTFEGQNVTNSSALITLQLDGSTPVSAILTKYFQVADGSFYKMVSSTGVIYVPSSQTALPNIPKVGDIGALGTFTGNDGTTATVTWALNADSNGASILVISSIVNSGTTVVDTEVDTYYLNVAGIPTKVAISTTIYSGSTVTLAGIKN